jgi:hypothetical protein
MCLARNWQTKVWLQVITKQHSHLCEKPVEYFETRQVKQWSKSTTISDKTEEASCAVAEIVARNEMTYSCLVNKFTNML